MTETMQPVTTPVIPADKRDKLLDNFKASRKARGRLDHTPVVKLAQCYGCDSVWLTEMATHDHDVVFGLAAGLSNLMLPTGLPDVSLAEMRLSDLIAYEYELDETFVADRLLSEYEAEEIAYWAEIAEDSDK